MFASDACRQRYHKPGIDRESLRITANHRESPEIDRELTANHRELSANRPGLINQRDFTVIFTITFAGNSNPGEWDLGLLDVSIKAEIARIIQNYLEYQYSGWKIRVKIVSKPQFTAF